MINLKLIEALRALELPVDEIESIPAIGLLNPVVLTVLVLEYIDILPPEKQVKILHKSPVESLLNNRRIISALDFLCLYDCMASSKISLTPAPAVIEVKSIEDLYRKFKDVLRRICYLVKAIITGNALFPTQGTVDSMDTQVTKVEENPLGLSPLVYCMKNNKAAAQSDHSSTVVDSFFKDNSAIQTKLGTPFEFTFTEEDIDNYSYKGYEELPFELDKYIYVLNLAVLRRVGVCTAPCDIHFSFHLTTTVSYEYNMKDTGTYYVPLHSPAPIILQPESSTFDQVEPELIELSKLHNTSDSEDNDSDSSRPREHIFTRSKQIEEQIDILNPSYAKTELAELDNLRSNKYMIKDQQSSHTLWQQTSNGSDGITLSLLPSSTDTKQKWFVDNSYVDSMDSSSQINHLRNSDGTVEYYDRNDTDKDEQNSHSKFSHLSATASDKVYEASPSSSQHNSFRASIEDNKSLSHSHSHSQGTFIYGSDEDDSLAPSRVTFNEAVEVDPGRYYKLKPFDEMQDVINSTALINNMSVHIHELEEKVSALMSENDRLLNKYTLAVNEHEHEKASLNTSLSEALQKIRTLETRILELEIKQSGDVYFTKLSASSTQPTRSYIVDPEMTRSLTARPQHTRQCPEISFSPAPTDSATTRGLSRGQRDMKYNTAGVSVTAVVPQSMDGYKDHKTTNSMFNPEENLELRDLNFNCNSNLNPNILSTPARLQVQPSSMLDPLALALSTPKHADLYSSCDYTHTSQRPSLFSNMQRFNVTPMKSAERRDRRAESFDGGSHHLKKTKKQRSISPGREKKDAKDTSSNASSALVKEMLEKIISSSSIHNKAYLIGANQVKAETLSSQIRSMSIEREAPMKPPGSPTSSVRRFRHTSAITRGNRQ